jgi:hypothetical protein
MSRVNGVANGVSNIGIGDGVDVGVLVVVGRIVLVGGRVGGFVEGIKFSVGVGVGVFVTTTYTTSRVAVITMGDGIEGAALHAARMRMRKKNATVKPKNKGNLWFIRTPNHKGSHLGMCQLYPSKVCMTG